MLFSRKENIFKCLVVFGKILWKIFSGVWLCCWKYHRKYIFYFLLTFSQIFSAAKQMYNFIPQSRNTNNTQKKKFIIRSRLGSTTGEIARSRLVLRSRLGSTTGDARTIDFPERRRNRGRRSGSRTTIWVEDDRFWGATRSGRWSESGSFGFFLSLSLSLCARARLPLTQLSLCFPKNGNLKVK